MEALKWKYSNMCTRVTTRWLPLVGEELLTIPEHLSSPPVFSGIRVTRSLVFCVMFCRSLFVSFVLFLWPLCCLSLFTHSDYPFGIFKLFLTFFTQYTKSLVKIKEQILSYYKPVYIWYV
jgi:hypothetical protein